ncbi:hypothetical protein J6590_000964 [Homalodisca vitripennis]|nr:hypothetical protein J6590_000964 [Homalodisca vitripennis]
MSNRLRLYYTVGVRHHMVRLRRLSTSKAVKIDFSVVGNSTPDLTGLDLSMKITDELNPSRWLNKLTYYNGPTAIPHILHNSYLAAPHEVGGDKNELATQSHGHGYRVSYGYSFGDEQSWNSHGGLRYQGPATIPHVMHDGHIADTHEVEQPTLTISPP